MTTGRSRRWFSLVVAVSGAIAAALSSMTWVQITTTSVLGAPQEAAVSGTSASPMALACALTVLAGGVALTLARRIGAIIATAVTELGAVLLFFAAFSVARAPDVAAGATGGSTVSLDVSAAVPVVCALAIVAAVAAPVAAWTIGAGPARPDRHDRASAPDAWDQLSAGEDPSKQ